MAFSLANNHTLDHGVEGLEETRVALAAVGADAFGAGINSDEASRPLLQHFQIGEKKFTLAVFGAFEYRQDYDREFRFYAREDSPGTAQVDVPQLRKMIAEAKRTASNLFTVYFVHWGGNYQWKSPEQSSMMRELRDAGVDLVVGHGAHMLQEIEPSDRGWSFYSIGNFLFNARGRYSAITYLPTAFHSSSIFHFSMIDFKQSIVSIRLSATINLPATNPDS